MIEYDKELNAAQYEAATTLEGPLLVIAGAGSGKTRTIVYRLARLVESGVPPFSILLLTFTRKAAQEMLERARQLMQRGMSDFGQGPAADRAGADIAAVQGGTFHAYAYSVLRIFPPEAFCKNITVMDSHDILSALQHCREELKAGKGDRSFPKNQALSGFISKSRNKELPLEDIIRRDASHLLPHAAAVEDIAAAYAAYKRGKNMLDYDDLLFFFEEALVSRPEVLDYCRARHRYIMVDEYQDTNPVQARIAGLVAGLDPLALARGGAWRRDQPSPAAASEPEKERSAQGPEPDCAGFAPARKQPVFSGNIMVVGDDAQSIYAFRGADVRNILRFPDIFPGTRIIRLEENYRSTQPVLDLSNAVLAGACEGYGKHLYTRRPGGEKPNIVRPMSDRSQAVLVAGRIEQLMRRYAPGEIAVLFRAGFHSYALELALNKMGLSFCKYGGLRYTEAAHIKDVMSFVRLVLNPLDYTAFSRMAELSRGVGSRTCLKLYQLALAGDATALARAVGRFPELAADLAFLDAARREGRQPAALLERVIEHYRPRLEQLYPEDYPRRVQGLEEFVQMAMPYSELDLLVADLSLEDQGQEGRDLDSVVLSTIHSAKGLEWPAVIILDLVEERFPSRHSLVRPDDFEEERRLMYVACTRARDILELYVPASIFDKGSGGSVLAMPSPFVREIPPELYTEWQESYTGALVEKKHGTPASCGGQPGPGPSGFIPGLSLRAGAKGREGAPACVLARPGEGPCGEDTVENGLLGEGRAARSKASECGFCHHRIFGRGKIVQHLPPDKVRVNFPGVGLKVIMTAYLSMED
ncbi:ATP-dependent helicase [Desulfovibrio sp. OttesenSCG-928-A18]|nr:ATP-dependent helicase [Desulfovibrio sp. OttesenSCG-928-A18]